MRNDTKLPKRTTGKTAPPRGSTFEWPRTEGIGVDALLIMSSSFITLGHVNVYVTRVGVEGGRAGFARGAAIPVLAQSVDIGMSAFPPLLKGKPDIAQTGDDFRV